jgi:DNA-binding NtrC family response regulator
VLREVDLLLVSSIHEHRSALMEILGDLPAHVIAVETAERAKEVLSQRAIAVVLCQEHLVDGTYRDVLPQTMAWRRRVPLVVMLVSDGWKEYHAALSAGAAEALRWPSRAIDLELALIRALRHRVTAMAMEA